ncbi:Sestrin-1 [Merluccius polli]|uniref:Sestrin-1 n=1 Tax=Merluccius polli TaxID=89951 RepID=A0AA47MVU2_MERPO|nr:Sestrin-1 [Merluccius polli]
MWVRRRGKKKQLTQKSIPGKPGDWCWPAVAHGPLLTGWVFCTVNKGPLFSMIEEGLQSAFQESNDLRPKACRVSGVLSWAVNPVVYGASAGHRPTDATLGLTELLGTFTLEIPCAGEREGQALLGEDIGAVGLSPSLVPLDGREHSFLLESVWSALVQDPLRGLFSYGDWLRRTSVRGASAYLHNVCWERERRCAVGLQQLRTEQLFTFRNKDLQKKIPLVLLPTLDPLRNMRHATAPRETVGNNLLVTDILKMCSHCERLSKKDLGVRIPRPLGNGPSRFIPEKEILHIGKVDDRTQSIFEDAFVALGRLDNISLVMGFHPQYLEGFLRTQHYLLQMDGPLSLHYRHYIGIMAAARHQCSYLVNLHVNDFLQVGGDPKWLNGLDGAPQKLQHLGELNKILAHRPWLLTKQHIENLLKAEEHSWSLAELIHAVVLLTHYHSLASFTFGCGITPDIHCEGGHTFRPPSLSQYCVCDIANGNGHAYHHDDLLGIEEVSSSEVEVLMEKMKQLQECREEEEASQEEMVERFEREKTESMLVVTAEDEESAPSRDVSRHFEDPSYGYKDFSRRGEHVPTFRVQDYSWEDHGFSLVNRLYPDVGQMLDEKFQMAASLTYNTMASHKDVDTSMLRRAIWNYIHCMFGIRYDDYDYGEINQLLDRSFKIYIKTMVCIPENTTKRMYESFWRQFQHSEKVHVNLLLMEARMQAELLYALRAITRYMT